MLFFKDSKTCQFFQVYRERNSMLLHQIWLQGEWSPSRSIYLFYANCSLFLLMLKGVLSGRIWESYGCPWSIQRTLGFQVQPVYLFTSSCLLTPGSTDKIFFDFSGVTCIFRFITDEKITLLTYLTNSL